MGKIAGTTSAAGELVKTIAFEIYDYYKGEGFWIALDKLTDLGNQKTIVLSTEGQYLITRKVDPKNAASVSAWHKSIGIFLGKIFK